MPSISVSLYAYTLSLVLKTTPYEFSFEEIYNSFSSLTETLLCTVCQKLLVHPTEVYNDFCRHNICKTCTGSLKLALSNCKGCKMQSQSKANTQLRVVIECYKKMCSYMLTCGFFNEWTSKCTAAQLEKFIRMVKEGADIKEDFHFGTLSEKSLEKKRLLGTNSEESDDRCSSDLSTFKKSDREEICDSIKNYFVEENVIEKTSVPRKNNTSKNCSVQKDTCPTKPIRIAKPIVCIDRCKLIEDCLANGKSVIYNCSLNADL